MNRTHPVGENKLQQLHEAMLEYRQLCGGSSGRKLQTNEYAARIVACTIDLQQGDTITMPSGRFCQNQQPTQLSLPENINRLGLSIGIAFASFMQRNNRVVLSFLEREPPHAGLPLLRFAQERSLAIICVAGGPISRSTKTSSGMPPEIRVDANDVMAIYRVAFESIEKARRGAGPTWIECVAQPHNRRTGKRRSSGSAANHVSALERFEQYLRNRNLWPPDAGNLKARRGREP
jgi:hypothetical protein